MPPTLMSDYKRGMHGCYDNANERDACVRCNCRHGTI